MQSKDKLLSEERFAPRNLPEWSKIIINPADKPSVVVMLSEKNLQSRLSINNDILSELSVEASTQYMMKIKTLLISMW